jgi:hypothetical protein
MCAARDPRRRDARRSDRARLRASVEHLGRIRDEQPDTAVDLAEFWREILPLLVLDRENWIERS